MIEDELLKLRFKAGRIDALQRIYEKYRDYLLTLAMAMVNDAATAEDVVHDAFVAFAQSGARFRLRGSLRAYLATCVVNRIRDRMRARRRQGQALDEEMTLESDFDPPDGRILSDERSRLVGRALARLPEEQRETIALHLNGQLKFREIARLQNIPLTTVRGRYRHGIEKLRSILNGRL
ncbi:MAG: sigma-70 family RNA polymerase sigma factor [Sedimentisphaerales bacterium]|jgi:RNA polymerase sigma-70 factor (ECF subfamily)|nr:sigma-70 family RNA polymerase sigma factor [Sedimentisphaerales bacterium]NLT75244.1 sigma-70 family RNA polymerase sigma factor [Planctomycetota bacterium]